MKLKFSLTLMYAIISIKTDDLCIDTLSPFM